MKHKNKYLQLNRYTLGLIGLLLISIIAIIIFINHRHIETANLHNSEVTQSTPTVKLSQFKFSGTANWWQGATNQTSMALFHTLHDSCFVSVQHKMGIIGAEQAKQQKTSSDLKGSGYTITQGSARTMTIQTKSGPKQYQLELSSIGTPAGQDKLDGGQEFGYLQLSDSYLFIEGHCETEAELQATIPALEAVSFQN